MNKRALRGWTAGLAAAFVLAATGGSSGEALAPPFGLRWGDSPARLLDWAARTHLNQVVKVPANQPRLKILTVSAPGGNLPKHDASEIEAHFVDGMLVEVTLHYNFPGKPVDVVKGKFASLKRLLTLRHGVFKPAGKKEDRGGGIATESEAFRVEAAGDRHLLLVLTEVRDLKRGDAEARFSVLYHGNLLVNGDGPHVLIGRDEAGLPQR